MFPTKLYHQRQTGKGSGTSHVMCRMCGKLPENVSHVLAGCGTLSQTKYLARHNAALKSSSLSCWRTLNLFQKCLNGQAVKELVGEKSATILQRMQRSVISSTLNIARSFKFLLKRILAKVLGFRKKFHWNFYWKLYYDSAIYFKLNRMVDKILGQTATSLFLI